METFSMVVLWGEYVTIYCWCPGYLLVAVLSALAQDNETELAVIHTKFLTLMWFGIIVQIKKWCEFILYGKYYVKKFITNAQNLQISFRNQP